MVKNDGERMVLNFNVNVENSTAIRTLSYNSETEVLSIEFIGSPQTYIFEDIPVADMLEVVGDAVKFNSWGKAYHLAKRRMELKAPA